MVIVLHRKIFVIASYTKSRGVSLLLRNTIGSIALITTLDDIDCSCCRMCTSIRERFIITFMPIVEY